MSYAPGDILLEKYRIEALLGQGAFGEVYRVMHLSLRVPRALKVLRHDAPGIGSSEYADGQARFHLEAQLGAQLNSPTPHPNLLQVHNFEAAEDLLVLEMEYAPDGSLAERIQKYRDREQAFPLAEALQIAAEVASGLAALHARDFIHRDIKPNNILFDQNSRAKVSDFGLAQVPGGPSMRSKLSNPTSQPGTPAYMSPEQTNTQGVLKPPSDIYSLGLVLFEMLTARNYTFLRPGTRAKTLRAEIPSALDDLLASMLAEALKDRPWDGKETAGLLREVLTKLQNAQAEDRARKKAEAETAEKALLALAVEAQRKAQADAVEKAQREAEEQAFQTAQAQARAEAAVQALQAERKARENAFQSPVPKPADSRFSFTDLATIGLGGLAAVLFVFVVFLIYRSMVGGTPSIPAPTAITIAAGTELPGSAPPVTTDTPAQAPSTQTAIVQATPWALASTLSGVEPVTTDTPAPAPTSVPISTPVPVLIAGSTQKREKDSMVMVYVPAGTFWMGSENGKLGEKPVHTVTLDAYWIDQTEVTNGKYAQCVQAGICTPPSAKSSFTQTNYYGNSQFADYPVIYVDWNKAKAYCEWAGARLPSEAEWEKAARGTDARTFPWGEGIDKSYANYNTDVFDTTRVGKYLSGASPYYALDMAGNVWEWVADWYGPYEASSASNPTGPASGDTRVQRGGSWGSDDVNLRSAYRYRVDPTYADSGGGFRCSRSQ